VWDLSSSSSSLPAAVDQMQSSFRQLGGELSSLALRLLTSLAAAMNMPGDFFLSSHRDMLARGRENLSRLRSLFYPAGEEGEKV